MRETNKKVNIQFEYDLVSADIWCENCGRVELKPDKDRQIKDFKCKCGLEYKIPQHYIDTYHNKQATIVVKSEERQKRKVKNYIATFWRGNPQHENGGYETTREVRATTIELAEKRAEKEYGNPIYGFMSLIKVEVS